MVDHDSSPKFMDCTLPGGSREDRSQLYSSFQADESASAGAELECLRNLRNRSSKK
jgi:hypothetical protein